MTQEEINTLKAGLGPALSIMEEIASEVLYGDPAGDPVLPWVSIRRAHARAMYYAMKTLVDKAQEFRQADEKDRKIHELEVQRLDLARSNHQLSEFLHSLPETIEFDIPMRDAEGKQALIEHIKNKLLYVPHFNIPEEALLHESL